MACSMMECFIATFITVITLPCGLSEIVGLRGTAGQSITLQTGVTGLHGDYQLIWSYGLKQHVLLNFDNGKLLMNESPRFLRDKDSGSLTIQNLTINDTGLYKGQILNGNGSSHEFNLTVVELDPTPTVEPPRNITANWRSHAAVVGSIVLSALVVIGLFAYAVRQKKINGKCRGNDAPV